LGLLGFAVYRLVGVFVLSLEFEYFWYHWLVMAAGIIFMAYSEGYKGFQKAFSPRVAARTLYIRENPTLPLVLFAPLFCMCFFFATKKRKIVAYSLTVGILIMITLFRQFSQPWRGVLDLGVVVGLSWGILATLYYILLAFMSPAFDVSPEISE